MRVGDDGDYVDGGGRHDCDCEDAGDGDAGEDDDDCGVWWGFRPGETAQGCSLQRAESFSSWLGRPAGVRRRRRDVEQRSRRNGRKPHPRRILTKEASTAAAETVRHCVRLTVSNFASLQFKNCKAEMSGIFLQRQKTW